MHTYIAITKWGIFEDYYEENLKGYLYKRGDFVQIHFTQDKAKPHLRDYAMEYIQHLTTIWESRDGDLKVVSQPDTIPLLVTESDCYFFFHLESSAPLEKLSPLFDAHDSIYEHAVLRLEGMLYLQFIVQPSKNKGITEIQTEPLDFADLDLDDDAKALEFALGLKQ